MSIRRVVGWGLLGAASMLAGCGKAERSSDDSGGAVPKGCASPALDCDGACVNPETDPENCGACGVVCMNGDVCSAGECASSCAGDTTQCGQSCVDLDADREHCGACGVVCGTSEVCAAGVCDATCSGGATRCGDRCVDLDNDPSHCGDCNSACADGEVCSRGTCGITCLGGSTLCDASCVALDSDPNHCGDCDTACDDGEVCSHGECGITCLGGTDQCGSACVDLDNDPSHCGRCSRRCATDEVCSEGLCTSSCNGTTQCGERCIDTTHDRANCGDCGHACDSGEVCSEGVCGTGCTNSARCDDACVDPFTDEVNCGACGHACGPGELCENGTCGLHCDRAGLTECGEHCVDTDTDADNCGECFNACAEDRTCVAGECACGDGRSLCEGVCTDTETNPEHCGVCGVACGVNEDCRGGECDCREGTIIRCSGTCVDWSVSAAHCGRCDAPCSVGNVCTYGDCAAPTSDWPTYQYDVQHTGTNPVEMTNPPLRLVWSRRAAGPPNPPAVQGGRIFVTSSSNFATNSPLEAWNVSDGSDLWSHNFGGVFSVGVPSVFNGAVYLANGKASETAYLWSFDPASGNPNWGAAVAAQWEKYWAPIRVGNRVYTNGGSYGGLYGFASSDGAQQFFLGLDQYDEWSPGYFGDHIFTFIAGHFRKHDPTTGAVISTVNVDWQWNGYSMGTAPVFGPSLAYVIAPPNLYAIDTAQNRVAWTANGTYRGTPAIAGNAVLGITAGNLVARDASTGALLWTFVGDTALEYPPVTADNYAFVASRENVYAVNLTTHQSNWTANVGGWLAIAATRLIVASPTGVVSAYVPTD